MVQREDYERREQAYVKHYVLTHYLQQLALKRAGYKPGTTINYIDGFSGPWKHLSEDLRDTSPHVALTELLRAQDTLKKLPNPIDLQVRGMFVESGREAFTLLQGLLRDTFSTVETRAYNGKFEDHIEDALQFARQGPHPFAFVFIDPTGWTGYGLKAITPLLRVQGEVLINFMTKDISRFVDDVDSSALQSFIDLFGDATYREAWRGFKELDREDRIVEAYCARVLEAGSFAHCGATVILNPQHDRTHYHLVYATRSLHGLVAFRDTERKAIPAQSEMRAEAKQRERVKSRLQAEMFAAPVMETSYMGTLQQRYQQRARSAVARELREHGETDFDDLVATALQHPMTSLGDLKEWLAEWQRAHSVEYLGLAPGTRALAISKRHRVRWRGGSLSGA